ncbi:MAG: family 43 glycosylhydrolase [Firmicutes bacterium]|nr:family 43 glycosylhydrolase [Bacillota bacterium]
MKKDTYFCNPVNVPYRYQFNRDPRLRGKIQICREAADPSMILFKGKYYIFPSMNLGVWVSDDLAHWHYEKLPEELPLYDYAPDVRVMGEYVYFCASRREENCDRYRTKDIVNGPYEKLEGSFPFWDPNLFIDDDGKVYFYWGCSNVTPIYGTELDPETMNPMGKPVECISGHPQQNGYERVGEDNSISPAQPEEIERKYRAFLAAQGIKEETVPESYRALIRGMFSNRPYIEGAWMDKHDGKYYLQYAFAGTQYNTYGDGVYVSDSPLGPFHMQRNNPYSYQPGGFLPGAGHGSTMKDREGHLWHTATMRISVHHDFERRVGIWPAGYDRDGELFCNQRYGDWPRRMSGFTDPFEEPEWMLLSAGKTMTASSFLPGHEPGQACVENVRTYWRAASNNRSEWLQLDLGKCFTVHAVQINFADDKINIPVPGKIRGTSQARYIDGRIFPTQWKLEGSADGRNWDVLCDKSDAGTDLPHDLIVLDGGKKLRFLRLSNIRAPYDQNPCISGLRVFGKGENKELRPCIPAFAVSRTGDLDMQVSIQDEGFGTPARALGYDIVWGYAPDKLYHSCMTYADEKEEITSRRIGALVKGENYYVRVDAFNEYGITHGVLEQLPGCPEKQRND